MKKSTLLLLLLVSVISMSGCAKEADMEPTMQVAANKAQIAELESGELCFNDLLFINGNTTWEQLVDQIGEPDAVDMQSSQGNLTTYVFKLKDNGALKIQFKGSGECFWAYIVYDDSIIALLGSDDFYEFAGENEDIDIIKRLKDIDH